MNKKLVCFIMSTFLSLSLVACSNNQYSEQGVKEIQNTETSKDEKTYTIPPSDSEQDTQEKQETEVKETEEETTKDIEIWKCPICGYSDCPSAEETGSGDQRKECLRYYKCDLCGKGNLLDNMEIWTAETTGQQLATCKGECTRELQEEYANDLASFNCTYCQDTGVLPGGTICDACHCRGCGELKENCICNFDSEWDPSWSTKADSYYED